MYEVIVYDSKTNEPLEMRDVESTSAYNAAISAVNWSPKRDMRFTLGNCFKTADGTFIIRCRHPYRIEARETC